METLISVLTHTQVYHVKVIKSFFFIYIFILFSSLNHKIAKANKENFFFSQ